MLLSDSGTGISEHGIRYWLSALLAAVAGMVIFFSAPGHLHAATKASILFVSSQTSTPYLRFIEQTRQELRAGSALQLNIMSLPASQLNSGAGHIPEQPYDLVIALGRQAAEAIAQWNPATPVLYTLIPKTTYNSLRQSGNLVCPHKRCTAIYIDQPIKRLIRVLGVAFREQRHLGVLLGPSSLQQRDELVEQAVKAGFILHTEAVRRQDELLPALNRILEQSRLLLAIADPVVYNRRTAKSILLTTYRHKVPVVAYSRAYADAGAALSVYSTPEQIARQTTDIIETFFSSRKTVLPSPQYPQHYSIRINQHVAESLGLDLAANPELQSIIKEAKNE